MKNRMKAIRLYKELTQKDFGKMLNVDQTAISNWETQKNNPDLCIATKVSEVFKIPLDFIYGKEFVVTRPIAQWQPDEREDMENANPNARDVFLFKYGHGIFENIEKEKSPSNEAKLAEGEKILLELFRSLPDDLKELYIETLRAWAKSQK